jgi:hypothetical protein
MTRKIGAWKTSTEKNGAPDKFNAFGIFFHEEISKQEIRTSKVGRNVHRHFSFRRPCVQQVA